MPTSSREGRKNALKRWGTNAERFSCRISTIDGVRVAVCKLGKEEFIGRGKDTMSALRVAIKKM